MARDEREEQEVGLGGRGKRRLPAQVDGRRTRQACVAAQYAVYARDGYGVGDLFSPFVDC